MSRSDQAFALAALPIAMVVAGSLHAVFGQSAMAADATPHSLTALLGDQGFVRISPGEFTMGSREGNPDEQPPHRVRISKSFELGKFEVTQAQWEAVMRNPHVRSKNTQGAADVNPSHFKGPSRPVENVSWDAVQQFIRALNLRDPGRVYRLPTEAEWEYAAKASTDERPGTELDSLAWCDANSDGQTQAIGQKAPNAWGLHDVLGNVLEWVQDWYGMDYYDGSPDTDPHGPASGSYKVYRGGGWLSAAKDCRAGFRGFDFPSTGSYSVGFRLVRTQK